MSNTNNPHAEQPDPQYSDFDNNLEDKWNEPIIVYFPRESGYDHIIYTPDTPTRELELLAYAYEQEDPYTRDSMTHEDYCRLCAWLLVKEIGCNVKSQEIKSAYTGKCANPSSAGKKTSQEARNQAGKTSNNTPPKSSSTATLDPPGESDQAAMRALLDHGNELLRQSGLDPNPKLDIADEYFSFVVFMWLCAAAVSGVILLVQTQGNVSESAELLYRLTLAPWLGQSAADLFPSRLPRAFETMAIILHGIPFIFLLVIPAILFADYVRKKWNLSRTIRLGQMRPDDLRGSLEKPHIIRSSYSLTECTAAVKSALDLSRKGKNRWSILIFHPGQFIHAELQFVERFGGTQELLLNRQILLSVSFTEHGYGTDIQLDYEILSPLSRYTCEGIVQRMTNQLELALSV